MRAGAAANHQKKRILNFAVQPNNACQATKNLALTTFTQNGRIGATAGTGRHAFGFAWRAGMGHVI